MNRRSFLRAAALAGTAAASGAAAPDRPAFRVAERRGRWRFLTPEGVPWFALGLNHIDAAALRAPVPGVWEGRYGNSVERWLREGVAPDLRDWGFNSVGWAQEVVVRGPTLHRHSPPLTFEEYQWLGVPYCHLLPFAEIHQWDVETRRPDFAHKDFADWCDYVARAHCARMRDDPKLIGYFYSDCPMWVHSRPANRYQKPIFDPDRLATEAGRRELTDLATTYYKVTHDAVRRYDKVHLILGDRYDANARLAAEVLRAAAPFVDVFSFQHFGTPAAVAGDLSGFHKEYGKPVLLADHAVVRPQPGGTARTDGAGYAELLRLLRGVTGCVGVQLCGAYLRNNTRKRGLRGPDLRPDEATVAAIRDANRDAAAWLKQEGNAG